MLLGYNTNGLAHHKLFDAVRLLGKLGYRSVAITIDHSAIPPGEDCLGELEQLQQLLEDLNLRSVIETGARFLLDPRQKHEPTLVSRESGGRRKRVEFYKYAIDCAAELGSDCVSLWSGALQDRATPDEAFDRLVDGLREVLDYAARQRVPIGFEPEPGMFIDSMDRYQQLVDRVDARNLRLTLDVGHLHCQGEPVVETIRHWAPRMVNVHLEDMRRGRHEHLMFGEGEIDFPPLLRALNESHYSGGVYVELSRHSHDGPEVARKAFDYLVPMLDHSLHGR